MMRAIIIAALGVCMLFFTVGYSTSVYAQSQGSDDGTTVYWVLYVVPLMKIPNKEDLKAICKMEDPEAKIQITGQIITWRGSSYNTFMVACGKQDKPSA